MQNNFFKIDNRLLELEKKCLEICKDAFSQIDENTEYCQQKMLKSFIDNNISESHFTASTGYGYGDRGRDALDSVYAQALEAEDALVRHNFVSGTHALTVALFGVLRPGDKMLSVTGIPYDTLRGVIGIPESTPGSLREFGIEYEQIELKDDGTLDFDSIEKNVYDGLFA